MLTNIATDEDTAEGLVSYFQTSTRRRNWKKVLPSTTTVINFQTSLQHTKRWKGMIDPQVTLQNLSLTTYGVHKSAILIIWDTTLLVSISLQNSTPGSVDVIKIGQSKKYQQMLLINR